MSGPLQADAIRIGSSIVSDTPSTAFNVANSALFNDGSSQYLRFTPANSDNDGKTFSIIGWIKRAVLGSQQTLFSAGNSSTDETEFFFNSSDQLQFVHKASGTGSFTTTQVFRDPHAWIHIILAVDSTAAVSDDTMRLWINGSEVTSFAAKANISANQTSNMFKTDQSIKLGSDVGPGNYIDGYMAEIMGFSNSPETTPTRFGEYDSNGVWRPIDPTSTFSVSSTAEAIVNVTSAVATGPSASYTFSSLALGTESADRAIYMFVSGQDPEGNNMFVSSLTVGGEDGRLASIVDSGAEPHYGSELWRADVPSGTTADIIVTWDQPTSQCGIIVWAVSGDHFLYDLKTDLTNSTSSVSFTGVPDNSVILAGKAGTGSSLTSTWSSAVTENVDQAIDGTGPYQTGASKAHSTGGSFTVTCTPSGTDNRPRMIAIVLSPFQGIGTDGFYLKFTDANSLGYDYSGVTTSSLISQNTESANNEINKGDMDSAGVTLGLKFKALSSTAVPQVKIHASNTGMSGATIRIETGSSTAPSGTLVDSNGELTGFTSAGLGLKTITFPNGGPVLTAGTEYWLVLAAVGNWGVSHDYPSDPTGSSQTIGSLGMRAGGGFISNQSFGHEIYQVGNNFEAINSPTQTTDSPTKNLTAISPLASDAVTFSAGNLVITHNATNQKYGKGSITLPQAGKWGFKVTTPDVNGSSTEYFVGMSDTNINTGSGLFTGNCFFLAGSAGYFRIDGADISAVVNKNLTLEILYDAGNRHVKVNNFTSGANLVNYTSSGITAANYVVSFNLYGSISMTFDFGQNGYTPSDSGYSVISASNIFAASAPTIEDGSAHHQTILWSGSSGSNTATQTGNSGFEPDWAIIKDRDFGNIGNVFDAVRGGTSGSLDNRGLAFDSGAEDENNAGPAFGIANGKGTLTFTGAGNNGDINTSGRTYVGWTWLGANATSTPSGGTRPTTCSVNQTAGFSIVSWEGNNTNEVTIAHGLGATPDMIIYRKREGSQWFVQHAGCTGGVSNLASTKQLIIDGNDPEGGPFSGGYIDTVGPATARLKRGSSSMNNCNANGDNYIAYMFAGIEGYSKFDRITSETVSPWVYTGFKPSFVMIKRIGSADDWYVHDTLRDPINPVFRYLRWNTVNTEASNSSVSIDIVSNGFVPKIGGVVTTNNTFIYMAFAEHPFAGTTPATTR